MSKKPKPVQILGPDGKPYVAPPKPKPEATVTVEGGVDLSASIKDTSYTFDYTGLFGGGYLRGLFGLNPYREMVGHAKPAAAPLADAVAEQVEALTADFDGAGGEEMPEAPKDLTTYRDAFASARDKCDHRDAVEVMFGRQWSCDTCGRLLGREAMRKAGWNRWGL